ncbi:MAG: bifunctional histidinol-phosphatase/imidazoleglycerol-phosphate dehydratase HisB [Bacteroidaceae bacterium]|nr:bifunctional histidinol-phosphatase/imidazoleglycerol-phosphate dehydratase HisB [Bacteroidaceae bacterium]
MKKALFIDRDGTLIREPADEQIDSFEKLVFVPGMIGALAEIRRRTDYEFVLVSNQDGLGTESFPEETFWPVHNFILDTLQGEGITFDAQHIDRHFPEDNAPTRKPGTAMLTGYMQGDYDLSASYVIGDRDTDVALAHNLGCRALKLGEDMDWPRIAEILIAGERSATVQRTTRETDISVAIHLDNPSVLHVDTGLGFFNHMLEQIAHHGGIGLEVKVKGDLHVDEHHTIEDTGIVLGECLRKAVGNKLGLQRYGFSLPMDDCLCAVSLDMGGRAWLVWDADFKRERVGDVPTEMFPHFFKSLSDAAAMNLNIKAEGQNEHHKIEGIFKAFARALRMALRRDLSHMVTPSSKGTV